jgi:glyoxalase family protein
MESLKGIHHVTAMAGDPQANVDFYCGILGLRLVKLTINFDDPNTYHFYYGDAVGSPGTILTFFPLGQNSRATVGTGEVTTIGFAVPKGALPFWQEHLEKHSIAVSATTRVQAPAAGVARVRASFSEKNIAPAKSADDVSVA